MIDRIDIAGAQIAFCEHGRSDAPPLLLLNSLGTDWRMWEPQVAALGDRVRIVRCDFRGHGRSETGSAPRDLARLGEDVLAVCAALGVERTHVCGLSLGGLVAQWLAIHHPQRVMRLVLANTAARIGSTAGWQSRIEAVQRGGMQSIRELVLARFLSTAAHSDLELMNWRSKEQRSTEHRIENRELRTENREPRTESYKLPVAAQRAMPSEPPTPPVPIFRPLELVKAMFADVDPAGYIAACAALRDADLSASVTEIRVPTLIIGSDLDEATPPVQAVQLHEAIAGSALALIQGAAHLSNLEQPEVFTAIVRSFLERSLD
jgi:3-oxoadipate enol-lactonase